MTTPLTPSQNFPLGMIPTRVENLAHDENYFKADGISHSMLKRMGRSPAACKWDMDHPSEPSEAMVRGKALHCLVLTPDLFDRQYVCKTWDGRTKEGKEQAARVLELKLKALSMDDWEDIQGARASILAHPIAGKMIEGAVKTGLVEAGIYWMSPLPGGAPGEMVPLKGKIDGWLKQGEHGVLFDLKWISKAHPSAIEAGIYEQGIHSQLAHYRRGLEANGVKVDACLVIAVEQDAPYECYVYKIKSEALVAGLFKNELAIESFVACKESGEWQGGIEEIITVGLPPWAEKKDTQ